MFFDDVSNIFQVLWLASKNEAKGHSTINSREKRCCWPCQWCPKFSVKTEWILKPSNKFQIVIPILNCDSDPDLWSWSPVLRWAAWDMDQSEGLHLLSWPMRGQGLYLRSAQLLARYLLENVTYIHYSDKLLLHKIRYKHFLVIK